MSISGMPKPPRTLKLKARVLPVKLKPPEVEMEKYPGDKMREFVFNHFMKKNMPTIPKCPDPPPSPPVIKGYNPPLQDQDIDPEYTPRVPPPGIPPDFDVGYKTINEFRISKGLATLSDINPYVSDEPCRSKPRKRHPTPLSDRIAATKGKPKERPKEGSLNIVLKILLWVLGIMVSAGVTWLISLW